MKPSIKKIILTFGLFLVCVAAYSAVISLANHWLRAYGYDSKYTTAILIGSTIYVYYKLWKWLCQRLNLIESDDNSKSQRIKKKEHGE